MNRSPLVAIVVFSALAHPVWAAAPSVAPNREVKSGRLQLEVSDQTFNTARASSGARATENGPDVYYRFALAKGQRTPKDVTQLGTVVWRFGGVLSWRRGERRLRVDGVRVATKTRSVTARVAGRRMTVAKLDKGWLTSELVEVAGGYWPEQSGGPVTFTTAFRRAFKRKLGATPRRGLRGSIAIGLPHLPAPRD